MAAAVVATCAPFSVPGTNTQPLVNDPFVLFTTPMQDPVLLETVHLLCDYGNGAPAGDVFILRLLDKFGSILHMQSSPAFSAPDVQGNVEVCWCRGASETSYAPFFDADSPYNLNLVGFATLPLPDLILDTSSVVQMQIIQNVAGGGSSPFSVVAPVVTYDDGGASVSAGSSADILPLLVPTTG